jgi:PEP-CTERM motif
MKKVVKALAALAAISAATLGAVSASQAALIDFGVVAIGGTGIKYTGSTLQGSTALNLDSSTLLVSNRLPTDDSGLTVGVSTVSLSPTNIIYGSGTGTSPLGTDVIKSWTAGSDMFTETLTTVTSINRGSLNAIIVSLKGTLTDTGGLFTDTPISLILTANQAGGPGNVVSASLTNTSSSAIPEPSTWVMMGLGFAGLGYAAVRRGSKDRTALAI